MASRLFASINSSSLEVLVLLCYLFLLSSSANLLLGFHYHDNGNGVVPALDIFLEANTLQVATCRRHK